MLIKNNLNGFWAHVFQHLNWQFVAHRQSFSILFTGSKNHTSKGWIPNRISFLLWVTKKRAISKIEWREKTRSKQMGVKLLVTVQVHDRALLPANRILNLHRHWLQTTQKNFMLNDLLFVKFYRLPDSCVQGIFCKFRFCCWNDMAIVDRISKREVASRGGKQEQKGNRRHKENIAKNVINNNMQS